MARAADVAQDGGRLGGKLVRQLETLTRMRDRLEASISALTTGEVSDAVTLREVAIVLQRSQMVLRVAGEVEDVMSALGEEGAFLPGVVAEAVAGVEDRQRLVVDDYLDSSETWDADRAVSRLLELTTQELLELGTVAGVLDPEGRHAADLDKAAYPRGIRILYGVPALGPEAIGRIVDHYPDLQHVLQAGADELAALAGLDPQSGAHIKDELARIGLGAVDTP